MKAKNLSNTVIKSLTENSHKKIIGGKKITVTLSASVSKVVITSQKREVEVTKKMSTNGSAE